MLPFYISRVRYAPLPDQKQAKWENKKKANTYISNSIVLVMDCFIDAQSILKGKQSRALNYCPPSPPLLFLLQEPLSMDPSLVSITQVPTGIFVVKLR